MLLPSQMLLQIRYGSIKSMLGTRIEWSLSSRYRGNDIIIVVDVVRRDFCHAIGGS